MSTTEDDLESAPLQRAKGKFPIEVFDEAFQSRTIVFDDPIVTAAQIAERFGAHPLSQFKILQQLRTGEMEGKRPNETTDLFEVGVERFFIVRSDRSFDFSVDGRPMEWPLPTILGSHMRMLAFAAADQELVKVTPEGFVPVQDDDQITFRGIDVEEFRLVPRVKQVTVFYREQPHVLEKRIWTTEELMVEFQVTAGYKLDLIKPNGEFKELKPAERIQVREGMEFTSHVPAGQSS